MNLRLRKRFFIRNGSDTPKRASAWLKCRSLLAGEENMNRLQAGSYKLANERQAWWVVVGLKMPRGLPRGSSFLLQNNCVNILRRDCA
jgi:hypothetical protein